MAPPVSGNRCSGIAGACLSEVAWTAQLEEVMTLQAIYPDDVRLISAPGLPSDHPPNSNGHSTSTDASPSGLSARGSSSGGSADGADVCTAEALLAAGYPASALEGAGGDGSPPLEPVAVEAVVHVEVPQGGLQLALGVGQRRQAGQQQQQQREGQHGEEASTSAPAAIAVMPFGPRVQHLSPLRLVLTMVPGYPAEQPPEFEVQAMWLSPAQAQQLRAALQGLWAEQGPGGPIGFVWIDWLRSASLEHLGVKDTLVLRGGDSSLGVAAVAQGAGGGPSTSSGAGAAGPGGGAGSEDVAMMLLRYNAMREYEEFQASFVTCAICFGQFLGRQCVRLPECRHAYCRTCISTHVRTQLGDGAVDNMRCPEPSCRRALPPDTLHQLLTQDEFQRWEGLLLQRTLDKMEDLTYCPRCKGACLEDEDHCTLCPHCYFAFCALCMEAWHPGSVCLDAASKLAVLEARRQQGAYEAGLNAQERARQELNRINELKGLALVQETTKPCPCCGMAVEKNEGCNKITCTYCHAYWCWKCGAAIQGYEHFNEQSGQCVLFDMDEINRWNLQMQGFGQADPQHRNRDRVEQRAGAHAPRVGHCLCTVCGQHNVKEHNNNLIRCWACQSAFCYLCRATLRGPGHGKHFGPDRCKQHSPD